jgi:hypothetical protein
MPKESLIVRDFNLVVNETENLYGKLIATTPGGVEVERAEYKPGGLMGDRHPILGLKFRPFKFKVVAFPRGLTSLPIGEPITLSWTQYALDEENPENEFGVRHFYECELDPPEETENKSGELVNWDYQAMNTRVYRRYEQDKLQDELDLKTNNPMLNGKRLWPNRRRILQLG